MARIGVVDDTAVVREAVAEALRRSEHCVTEFADSGEALEAVKRGAFDLIVTDLKIPKLDGIGLLRAVREQSCDTLVLVMTAYGTVATAVEAMKLGAFDFIQKPFDAEALVAQVDRALRHRRLHSENEAWRRTADDLRKQRQMIGDGSAMTQVRVQIAQYAASGATVLISGESGTGKELAAAAIHEASGRRERPMLCLNCAALSASLLESELFGHERGAFTGADRTRRGRFELADGGTLLLDEISEMALPLQAKLLRVLQEGEFERVGSSTTQRADVRLLATTNRVLEDWVAKKRFRADLYYRLNVLPLRLPPLRERPEDLPFLVTHFLTQAARRNGRESLSLEPAGMKVMSLYDWPGNVRELENVCERLSVTSMRNPVSAAEVEPWLTRGAVTTEAAENLRHGRLLEDMERQLIEHTLRRYGGHRAKSAQALGMGVRTLGLKLKNWRDQTGASGRRRTGSASP